MLIVFFYKVNGVGFFDLLLEDNNVSVLKFIGISFRVFSLFEMCVWSELLNDIGWGFILLMFFRLFEDLW